MLGGRVVTGVVVPGPLTPPSLPLPPGIAPPLAQSIPGHFWEHALPTLLLSAGPQGPAQASSPTWLPAGWRCIHSTAFLSLRCICSLARSHWEG